MFSQGLNTSAAAHIGQQIGKQNVTKAKEYYKVTLWVSFIIISSIVLSIVVYAEEIISVFTNSDNVIKSCKSVIPLFVCGVFPDLWQGYIQGVIKALGIQGKVIIINVIGYWFL